MACAALGTDKARLRFGVAGRRKRQRVGVDTGAAASGGFIGRLPAAKRTQAGAGFSDWWKRSFCQTGRLLLVFGQYDPRSALTVKNVMRQFHRREPAYPIVHNTGWLDAVQQGDVVRFLFRNRQVPRDHENHLFMQQVRALAQAIVQQRRSKQASFRREGGRWPMMFVLNGLLDRGHPHRVRRPALFAHEPPLAGAAGRKAGLYAGSDDRVRERDAARDDEQQPDRLRLVGRGIPPPQKQARGTEKSAAGLHLRGFAGQGVCEAGHCRFARAALQTGRRESEPASAV